jgi:UDP-N-acetylmuramate dehydrogenase
MLLTQDIDALVIHIDLKGKKNHKEDADYMGRMSNRRKLA